jgi:hypothetical protein
VFRCVLQLVVSHQDKPQVIRLRNKWVEMDPRQWNAQMDATVNVGLGSGSRDRDIMMLMQILQQQKELIATVGPFNPISGIDKTVNTLRKIVETAGMRNADAYFAEISGEEAQQWYVENMAGNEEPSPEEIKAQAQMQIEQAKLQGQMQMKQIDAQVNTAREEAQMQADLQVKRAEIEAKTIENRQKLEVDERKETMRMQFDAQKLSAQMQLEREKMAQQRQLELLKLGMQPKATGEDGAPVPTVFDDLANQIGQNSAQSAAEIQQQIAGMMAEMTQAMVRAVNAPKRVVRGPDGRAAGVETVMEQ